MKKYILFLVLVVFLSALRVLAKPPSQPAFILQGLDGTSYSAQSLRGKIVFLSFFSRACQPCKNEVPLLNKLQAQYPSTLVVLGVSFMEDNPDKVRAIVQEWGIKYPVCIDKGGITAELFEVKVLPRGFLIDENGVLVANYEGMNDKTFKDLLSRIDALSQALIQKRKAGCAFYVEPTFEVQEGNPSLAQKLPLEVASLVSQLGFRVVQSKSEAHYIITGKILDLGDSVAIEIIILDPAGKIISSFSVDISNNDFSVLKTLLQIRLNSIK